MKYWRYVWCVQWQWAVKLVGRRRAIGGQLAAEGEGGARQQQWQGRQMTLRKKRAAYKTGLENWRKENGAWARLSSTREIWGVCGRSDARECCLKRPRRNRTCRGQTAGCIAKRMQYSTNFALRYPIFHCFDIEYSSPRTGKLASPHKYCGATTKSGLGHFLGQRKKEIAANSNSPLNFCRWAIRRKAAFH